MDSTVCTSFSSTHGDKYSQYKGVPGPAQRAAHNNNNNNNNNDNNKHNRSER
jgi:hypothetical protein